MTIIKVKLLEHGKNLGLPSYATIHSAGADLRAAIEDRLIMRSMEKVLVPTGIAIELGSGYEAQIRPRSGLAVKFGITVLNSPGTIDADYRGEIKVCLMNFGHNVFTIARGDRIAQMIISPVVQAQFMVSEELEQTVRGEGGFGSTGE